MFMMLLGLNAGVASADAEFGLAFTRDEAQFPIVHRGDDRVDYKVEVSNTASPTLQIGAELFCNGIEINHSTDPKDWAPSGVFSPSLFAVEWVRNGVPIAGAGGSPPAGLTYTTTAADAGKVIQCLVKGTNAHGASKFASLPGVVINPPATAPPAPASATVDASRPAVSGSGTGMRTCSTAAMNWAGVNSFTFQWLADGEPIAGATTNTYTPTVATGSATRSTLATGTGARTTNSTLLENVNTTSGAFAVGESISGTGIPAGTTITAIDTAAGTITMSLPASFTLNANTSLFSGSKTLTGFSTTAGTFAVGDKVSGTGFAVSVTKIVAIDTVAGTVTLNRGPTAAGTGAVTGGVDNGKALQCMVVGENGDGGATDGGRLVGISNQSTINAGNTPFMVASETPGIGVNGTAGPVTVEVELPGGLGTRVHSITASGWSCDASLPSVFGPAKAVCTREDPLLAGGSYPAVNVITRLGGDAPDVAVANATVSGGGTAPAAGTVQFDFAPAKEFGFDQVETKVVDENGDSFTQAGGHPHLAGLNFAFTGKRMLVTGSNANPYRMVGSAKTIIVDAPRGFVGNVRAIDVLCSSVEKVVRQTCPPDSLVGGLDVRLSGGDTLSGFLIYAIEPERGVPAQFAFFNTFSGGVYVFSPFLRPDDGYAISFESAPVPAEEPKVMGADVELCGFGADSALVVGSLRMTGCRQATDPDASEMPLITNPTSCGGGPPTTVVSADSWANPGVFKSRLFSDPPTTGCDQVVFTPSVSMGLTSGAPDSASGLEASITVPSDGLEDLDGLSQAHLKKTVVELPEGVSVNPSAATGLEGCSDAQLGLGTDSEPLCPDGSKIATVTATTPVLEKTLSGVMVLRTPKSTDPQSGEMFRMALIVRNDERGLLVKLPGSAVADPQTGKITATFDDNPQLPIGTVKVDVKSGDRGVLAMPQACGAVSTKATLTPWSGNADAVSDTASDVDGDCSFGFMPTLSAGMDTHTARGSGKYSFRFTRNDGEQWLRGLTAKLPRGLLASVKDVPLCSNAQADAGACPAGSKIGIVDAKAGSGDPFVLEEKGEVFLTNGYKGGEYGLAVKVRPVAGPFRGEHELSPIVVRQAIHVDRTTAEVTAISDPFPLIHHGVPLRVREVTVLVDRDEFMLNPSDCDQKQTAAVLVSAEGTTADLANPFQVSSCADLAFKPKLALRLTGRRQVTTGKHPGIRAQVTQEGVDEAGIEKAVVRLPKSLALDVDNAQALCEFADGTKPDLENHCPAGSIVGRARAKTPLLKDDLAGNVYFVKNVRKDPVTGNEIRTLPMIVVALRGEIAVNLYGKSSTTKSGKLVNTFDQVPDAPVSQFNLNINGGQNGIIAVTRTRRALINLCAGRHTAEADMDGHNGRRHDRDIAMKTPCTKRQAARAKRAAKRAAARGARR